MKKTSVAKPRKVAEISKEYKLDTSKAKPNRFAASARDMSFVAVIDSDVAKIFTTAEQVNTALRALMLAIPQTTEQAKAVSLRSEKIMEIRKKLGAAKQNKKSSVEILSEMRILTKMKSPVTVDASVFVNAFSPDEEGSETSMAFLSQLSESGAVLIEPTLLPPLSICIKNSEVITSEFYQKTSAQLHNQISGF